MSDPVADAAAITSSPDVQLRLRQGVVSAVTSGKVSVWIGKSDTEIPGVPYLASYTPAAGDVVMILVASAASMVILGRVVS